MPRGRPRTHVSPCSFCNRQFKRLEHLRRHERIHTQEKPFSCDCGASFARKDLLIRHKKLAHAANAEEETSAGEISGSAVLGTSLPDHDPPGPPAILDPFDNNGPVEGNTHVHPSDEVVMMNDFSNLYGNMLDDLPIPDGFDWLWQSDPGFATFAMPSSQFQPLLFDTTAFGLFNPLEIQEERAAPGTLDSFPSAESFPSVGDAANFSHASSEAFHGADPVSYPPQFGPGAPSQSLPHESSDHAGWMIEGGLPAAPGDDKNRCPWRISAEDYEIIRLKIQKRKSMLPADFVLLSRHTLSRYLEGYIRGFHEHLPFLHLSTFCPAEICEALLLSMAAVGALYKYDMDEGYQTFDAARALVMSDLQELRKDATNPVLIVSESPHSLQSHPERRVEEQLNANEDFQQSAQSSPASSKYTDTPQAALSIIQAFNILVAMASWGKANLTPTAMEMAGQLATLVKWFGIAHPDPISLESSWAEWIRKEERRRTMSTAYALGNLQFIAFNTPTALTNQDIGLFLPHPVDMWRATSEQHWKTLCRQTTHRERSFRDTVMALLSDGDIERPTEISAFGNYILMSALVQQILIDRQASGLRRTTSGLSATLVDSLSRSIYSWAHCWASNKESTLDPLSINGPLTFNATALLRIAYIRLVADLGPHLSVLTRNPLCLARSVCAVPLPALQRSCYADFAVGQCVGALGILVRSGVNYVSRTHSHTWSIIHSLSHIECACFLSLWLRNLARIVRDEGTEALRPAERKLLGMIRSMVIEAGMLPPGTNPQDGAGTVHRLAGACVKIWAKVLQGDHVFEMVGNISTGLSLAADILESPHTSSA